MCMEIMQEAKLYRTCSRPSRELMVTTLQATFALAIAVMVGLGGVEGALASSRASTVWRGKTIEVRAVNTVTLNSSNDDTTILADGHRITVREVEISVDGTTKTVPAFKRILVETKAASVTVSVDGKPLFP
jgi:hypothetical protein